MALEADFPGPDHGATMMPVSNVSGKEPASKRIKGRPDGLGSWSCDVSVSDDLHETVASAFAFRHCCLPSVFVKPQVDLFLSKIDLLGCP